MIVKDFSNREEKKICPERYGYHKMNGDLKRYDDRERYGDCKNNMVIIKDIVIKKEKLRRTM